MWTSSVSWTHTHTQYISMLLVVSISLAYWLQTSLQVAKKRFVIAAAMPFLSPQQQCQSTEGRHMHYYTMVKFLHWQQYTNATVSYIETDRYTRADPGFVNGEGVRSRRRSCRGGWGLGRGCLAPRKIFEFLSQNGTFLCILQSAAVILGSENAWRRGSVGFLSQSKA